ncbi:hypothetical protein PsYK624_089950 [Phanerochaete sordida]|uniref:Uncharacterized protein n=1 Tax=Phanerochaete sordida TaxID=48140 RepID=A0A9P3GDQ2_9APHY|nr:hypothetical protein PsYK624_089950 [Phanerochaete sordida]
MKWRDRSFDPQFQKAGGMQHDGSCAMTTSAHYRSAAIERYDARSSTLSPRGASAIVDAVLCAQGLLPQDVWAMRLPTRSFLMADSR